MKTHAWIRLFAAIGVLATLAALALGALTLMMIRSGFSTRDDPSGLEAFFARRMRDWAIPADLRELKNPVPVNEQTLEEARAHWADHCASCHGNDGRGETDLGRGLYPRAPNMREEPTQSLADGELYAIIENGIRLSGMPGWGDGSPDNTESWTLVAFIRHLPNQTPAELERMKTLNPKSVHELQEAAEEDEFLNPPQPGEAP